MGDILNFVWILLLLQIFIPAVQRAWQTAKRLGAIRAIETRRKTRVITMIHRQESVNLLGIPVARYIDIEDSEKVLRAIRLTPPDVPIDIVVHTPGGLVLAAEQIAMALKRHTGNVTVFVPHYAMSGGTIIALAADAIVMDPNAVLGPVDPQLGGAQSYYPAASIVKALEQPNPNRDDATLILGDVARKALDQVYHLIYNLLLEHHTPEEAERIARTLGEGRYTHDYPIDVEEARAMGLHGVSADMPPEIYALMDLYPQAGRGRPSVEFIPTPYTPPGNTPAPGKGDQGR